MRVRLFIKDKKSNGHVLVCDGRSGDHKKTLNKNGYFRDDKLKYYIKRPRVRFKKRQ